MEDFMSRTHSKLSLAIWFSALALVFGAQKMSAATVTYIVGTCTSGTRFSTIQAALDASPAPNTVEVCPGQYAEQLTITRPVTIEGLTAANGALAEIMPGPMAVNASVFGAEQPVVAQVYVDHVTGGAVNLTNLNVNGMNQNAGTSTQAGFFVGILYEQSSGTIDQVITSSQNGAYDVGYGILIEGGSSDPSVTVENSSIHDFNGGYGGDGIYAIGGSTATAPDLTVTIKNNLISSPSKSTFNLVVEQFTDPTVSGNVVNGGLIGIYVDTPKGSISSNSLFGSQSGIVLVSPDDTAEEGTGLTVSGNTVANTQVGIQLYADGPSVTSNNILDSAVDGIQVALSTGTTLHTSVLENNTIKTVASGEGPGIELSCSQVSSSQVHSNTIMDAYSGYGDAPAGFSSSNTYLGVVTGVSPCSGDDVSRKASAAPRLKLLGQLRVQ
jgi:Periplasmic copper-binding protein (NosD)